MTNKTDDNSETIYRAKRSEKGGRIELFRSQSNRPAEVRKILWTHLGTFPAYKLNQIALCLANDVIGNNHEGERVSLFKMILSARAVRAHKRIVNNVLTLLPKEWEVTGAAVLKVIDASEGARAAAPTK